MGCVVGDTNTVGVLWEPRGRVPEVLTNSRGGRTTPSAAIYFAVAGTRHAPNVFTGEYALAKERRQPGGLITGVKKYVGMSAQDIDMESLQASAPHIRPDKTNTKLTYHTRIGNEEGSVPVERLPFLLAQDLKEQAEQLLPSDMGPVSQVVVGVPVFYSLAQREVLRRVMLTLDKVDAAFAVSEPFGTLVGSGLLARSTEAAAGSHVVVVDVGGSSLVVSVLREASEAHFAGARAEGVHCYECVAVHGNVGVGSESVDDQILADIAAAYKKGCGEELPEKKAKKLREDVANLKKTGHGDLELELPDDDELEYSMSGQQFGRFCGVVVAAVQTCLAAALTSGGVAAESVTHVVLSGGGAKSAPIEAHLHQHYPDWDIIGGLHHDVEQDPQHVSALGCALLGEFLTDPAAAKYARAMEANPHVCFYTPAASLHPDAAGTAGPDVVAVEVANHRTQAALAIEVLSGCHDILVKKNTPLPYSACRHFGCASAFARVALVELPADDAAHARRLGSVVLRLPAKSLGRKDEPSVCLKVTVTASGAVEILALDAHPDRRNMTVISSARLLRDPAYARGPTPTTAPAAAPVDRRSNTPQSGEHRRGPSTPAGTPADTALRGRSGSVADSHRSDASAAAVVDRRSNTPQAAAQGGATPPVQPLDRQPQAAAAPVAAAHQAAAAAPAAAPREYTFQEIDDMVTELFDQYQALQWFFEDMHQFRGLFNVPQDKVPAILQIMESAYSLTQSGHATGPEAAGCIQALKDACSFSIAHLPKHTGSLMHVALGLWQFVIAPQDDDTALLTQAFRINTPLAHRLDEGGDTLAHKVCIDDISPSPPLCLYPQHPILRSPSAAQSSVGTFCCRHTAPQRRRSC